MAGTIGAHNADLPVEPTCWQCCPAHLCGAALLLPAVCGGNALYVRIDARRDPAAVRLVPARRVLRRDPAAMSAATCSIAPIAAIARRRTPRMPGSRRCCPASAGSASIRPIIGSSATGIFVRRSAGITPTCRRRAACSRAGPTASWRSPCASRPPPRRLSPSRCCLRRAGRRWTTARRPSSRCSSSRRQLSSPIRRSGSAPLACVRRPARSDSR